MLFEETIATAVSREAENDFHIAYIYTTIDELTHTMVNPSGWVAAEKEEQAGKEFEPPSSGMRRRQLVRPT